MRWTTRSDGRRTGWVRAALAGLAMCAFLPAAQAQMQVSLPRIEALENETPPPLAISAGGVRLSVMADMGWDDEDPIRTAFAGVQPRARLPFQPVSYARPVLGTAALGRGMGLLGRVELGEGLYMAGGVYDMLGPQMRELGQPDPSRTGTNAPYARIAYSHESGDHSLDFGGTFLSSAYSPEYGIGSVSGAYGRNRFTDMGVEFGYRYEPSGPHRLMFHASFTHEQQDLSGLADRGYVGRSSAALQMARATVSYQYDRAWRFTLTGQQVMGQQDPVLYFPKPETGSRTGRPDTRSLVAQAEWMPFIGATPRGAGLWSLRLGVQYTAYLQFNGAYSNYDGHGRDASVNNLAYAYAAFRF